jgi:hypothetical protein
MQDAPDGRTIFTWRNDGDGRRLAEAIAEATATELFNMNGLVWLSEGRLVSVNINVLREIITKFIAGVRPINRGEFGWDVEYYSYGFQQGANTDKEPDQKVLLELVNILPGYVAKGPSEPRQLTRHQQEEIRGRRKQGEPVDNIARALGVDIDTVRALTAGP